MTKTSAIPTRRERGFTLIELLVVLGIMSLLAFLFAGRLSAPDRFATKQDVARVLAVMSSTRLQALSSGRPMAVPADDIPEGYTMAPALGGTEPAILFYPDGSSSGGAVSRNGKAVILVDWFSGMARHAG